MKRFHPVIFMALIFAILTQSFTPINKTHNTGADNQSSRFNYARFMRSLWMNPAQGMKKRKAPMATDYYVSIDNYWQANVIVNYVSLTDAGNPASGNFPLYPGDSGSATDDAYEGVVWVNISIPGPPEDPEATRILYYQGGVGFPGYHCQPISGSGTYGFIGVGHSAGARIIVDTGTCP